MLLTRRVKKLLLTVQGDDSVSLCVVVIVEKCPKNYLQMPDAKMCVFFGILNDVMFLFRILYKQSTTNCILSCSTIPW